ncbi:DNA excision repair protein ERCC-4 [Nematocida sp. AWRm78]|nr:DNA excision repair protein ERCC-4 [Nematocida sp. AWRm79]KAI5183293.1 DNA excision repair protein ERCC-4 [Nematocida sp. AWRm78]
MHGHERRIVKEVFSSKRTIHMLYKGVRLEIILKSIIDKSEETLVVLGATKLFIAKVKEAAKKKSLLGSATCDVANKIQEIDIKTPSARRQRIYNEIGCVFVNDQIFLSDILKNNVLNTNIRTVSVISNAFLPRVKTIHDFILFTFRGALNILFEWTGKDSFPDVVTRGYIPSSGIFLYPSFRNSVIKSFGDLEVSELTVQIDQSRRVIQCEILDLQQKVKSMVGKELFNEYITKVLKLLENALVILHNTSIAEFFKYFTGITDINYIMSIIVSMYGIADSQHSRTIVYKSALEWLHLPGIEIIHRLAGDLQEKEKEFPKEALIRRVLEKNRNSIPIIFTESIEAEDVKPTGAEKDSIVDSFFDNIYTVRKLSSTVHRALGYTKKEGSFKEPEKELEAERPKKFSRKALPIHIILMNYSIGSLRRINMCRNRWHRRGVDFPLTIINIRDSSEEINYLQETVAEKDAFLYGIGLKQNRPEIIEKQLYAKEAEDPKAPLLQIDIRELKSSLPLHLVQRFNNLFRFEFKQLTVGDYVLNQSYYIERKRIDDFVSSLKNGRLFKQLQVLEYTKGASYLLIEFSQKEKISFLSYANRLQEIDLTGRIVSLLQNMKNTYIFYSSIERHSSELINALARKPPHKLISQKKQSPAILEALMAVPGVDSRNIDLIFSNFTSLYDLITASEERLTTAMGGEQGKKIYEFFNT